MSEEHDATSMMGDLHCDLSALLLGGSLAAAQGNTKNNVGLMPALYVLPSARHNNKKKCFTFFYITLLKSFYTTFERPWNIFFHLKKKRKSLNTIKHPTVFFKLMILFLFCSYVLWYILKVTITP